MFWVINKKCKVETQCFNFFIIYLAFRLGIDKLNIFDKILWDNRIKGLGI